MLRRMAGIHQKIAGDVVGKGASLFCTSCGRERAITAKQGGQYLAKGWPECCGYTMRLVTQG